MMIEQITEAMRSQPFQPFILHLADGWECTIQHPEYLARVGAGRTVIVTSPDSEHSEYIDLLLITSLTRLGGNHAA
jgi:hypothetical protein